MKVEFSRASVYQIKRALAEHPVECQPQNRVDEQRHEDDQSEPYAIEKHHTGGEHGHRTVDQRRDEAFRQQIADRLDGAKAGDQITNVPTLEECKRQAQQMREQPSADIEGNSALQRMCRACRLPTFLSAVSISSWKKISRMRIGCAVPERRSSCTCTHGRITASIVRRIPA